jgi:hypothetical protein
MVIRSVSCRLLTDAARLTTNVSFQRSAYHLVVFFVLLTGKLYTLGLLRTLNSRVKLRQRMKSHDMGRTSLSDWQWEQEPNSDVGNPDTLSKVSSIKVSDRFRFGPSC